MVLETAKKKTEVEWADRTPNFGLAARSIFGIPQMFKLPFAYSDQ